MSGSDRAGLRTVTLGTGGELEDGRSAVMLKFEATADDRDLTTLGGLGAGELPEDVLKTRSVRSSFHDYWLWNHVSFVAYECVPSSGGRGG